MQPSPNQESTTEDNPNHSGIDSGVTTGNADDSRCLKQVDSAVEIAEAEQQLPSSSRDTPISTEEILSVTFQDLPRSSVPADSPASLSSLPLTEVPKESTSQTSPPQLAPPASMGCISTEESPETINSTPSPRPSTNNSPRGSDQEAPITHDPQNASPVEAEAPPAPDTPDSIQQEKDATTDDAFAVGDETVLELEFGSEKVMWQRVIARRVVVQTARRGEVLMWEILKFDGECLAEHNKSCMIGHKIETGYRHPDMGAPISSTSSLGPSIEDGAEAQVESQVVFAEAQSGSTLPSFSSMLRSTSTPPPGCNIGEVPNKCKGSDKSTWTRGLSPASRDQEYISSFRNKKLVIPESLAPLELSKAAKDAIADGCRDQRTYFTLSNFSGMKNFEGPSVIPPITAFPVSLLANKTCVENDSSGKAKGLGLSRGCEGIEENSIRFLLDGTPVFISTILVVDHEQSPDLPFTLLVACVDATNEEPILVPTTSITPISLARERQLESPCLITEEIVRRNFQLVLPLLGNGAKTDENCFEIRHVGASLWKNTGRVCFSPLRKGGRPPKKRDEKSTPPLRPQEKEHNVGKERTQKKPRSSGLTSELQPAKGRPLDHGMPKTNTGERLSKIQRCHHASQGQVLEMKELSALSHHATARAQAAVEQALERSEAKNTQLAERLNSTEYEAAYQKGVVEAQSKFFSKAESMLAKAEELWTARISDKDQTMLARLADKDQAMSNMREDYRYHQQLSLSQTAQAMNYSLLHGGHRALPIDQTTNPTNSKSALDDFLEENGLSKFRQKIAEMEIRKVSSLRFLTEDDGASMGMLPWQFREMQDAAQEAHRAGK